MGEEEKGPVGSNIRSRSGVVGKGRKRGPQSLRPMLRDQWNREVCIREACYAGVVQVQSFEI